MVKNNLYSVIHTFSLVNKTAICWRKVFCLLFACISFINFCHLTAREKGQKWLLLNEKNLANHYHEALGCFNLCSCECLVGHLGYHEHIIDSLVDCLQLNSWFQFSNSLVAKMSSITNSVCVFSEALPQLDPWALRGTSHISGWCDIWLRAAVSISRIIILPFLYFFISVEKTHCPSQLQCFIFLQLTYRNLHFFKKEYHNRFTCKTIKSKPSFVLKQFLDSNWVSKIIWPLKLDLVLPKVAVCLMEFTPKGKGNMTIWNNHLVILLEYPPQSWSVRTERATLGWTMMETKTKIKMIEQNRTMLEPNPIFLSLVGVDLPTCKSRRNEEEWFSDLGHVIAILHTETARTLNGTFNILCDYSFNFVCLETLICQTNLRLYFRGIP